MERMLVLKANYLSEKFNYDVTVVTLEQKGRPIAFHLSKSVRLVNFEIPRHFIRGKIGEFLYARRDVRDRESFINSFLLENNFDIAISFVSDRFFIPLSAVDNSIKVSEFHMSYYGSIKIDNKKRLFRKFEEKRSLSYFIRYAQRDVRFIVLTDDDKYEWQKYLDNVEAIPNPITINQSTISCLKDKRVIAIGRLTEQKGFHMLIEVWKHVHEKHPDWKLDIFGEGYAEKMLRKKIDEYGLRHTITLRGTVSEIEKEYLNSSLFVMLSRYEGFGLVILEALYSGLPVVAFKFKNGASELIDDGKSGFVVEQGDIIAFASKINLLIEDIGLRKKMGVAAYEKSKEFEIDTIMLRWKTLFETLTQNKKQKTDKI